jgi:hypothetical protein
MMYVVQMAGISNGMASRKGYLPVLEVAQEYEIVST